MEYTIELCFEFLNVHRFFGQLKEQMTERCVASRSKEESSKAQGTKVNKKADKAGSKLKDISRERTVLDEDNDIMSAMHDELDIGELFS